MDILTGYTSQPFNYDAVFTTESDNSQVSTMDFLNLMVQQLANQDFTNPVDDTQYLTQMAQFATMNSMEELASYSQQTYVMGLIGQTVTVASMGMGGSFSSDTGIVEMISLVDNDYTIQVNGTTYDLSQIMQIHSNDASSGSSVDVSYKGIEVSEITSAGATFNWSAATTNPDTVGEVKYNVYYSVSSLMDDVDKIKEYGTLMGDADRTELYEEFISGLQSGTTYYVNVIVTDEYNVEHAYQKVMFKTEDA